MEVAAKMNGDEVLESSFWTCNFGRPMAKNAEIGV